MEKNLNPMSLEIQRFERAERTKGLLRFLFDVGLGMFLGASIMGVVLVRIFSR